MSVLDLDTWARLSHSERLARAQQLAAQLPMGFACTTKHGPRRTRRARVERVTRRGGSRSLRPGAYARHAAGARGSDAFFPPPRCGREP